MKKLATVILFFALLVGITSQSQASTSLERAKELMYAQNYEEAAKAFNRIAHSTGLKSTIREAFYYWGYCEVKNSEIEHAKEIFERFLKKYENSDSSKFIPDAMYVLGRILEQLNDRGKAIAMYQKCRKKYPFNDYAKLSAKRLEKLGISTSHESNPFDENDNDNSHHNGNGHYCNTGYYNHTISKEIKDAVKKAKQEPDSYSRDYELKQASKMALNGEEYLYICQNIENKYTLNDLVYNIQQAPFYNRFDAKSLVAIVHLLDNEFANTDYLEKITKDFLNRPKNNFLDIEKPLEMCLDKDIQA